MALPNYKDRCPDNGAAYSGGKALDWAEHGVSPTSNYGYVVGTGSRFIGEGTLTLPKFGTAVIEWPIPDLDTIIRMVLSGNTISAAAKILLESGRFKAALPTPSEWKQALDPAFNCFGAKIKDLVDELWSESLDDIVTQKMAELQSQLNGIIDDVFPTPEEIAQAIETAFRAIEDALTQVCSILNGQSAAIISAMIALIPAISDAMLALIPNANEAWHSIYDPIRDIVPTADQISDAILPPIEDAMPTADEISEAIDDIVDRVATDLSGLSDDIINALKAAIPDAEALATQMLAAFVNAFPTQGQIMVAAEGAIKSAIQAACDTIATQIEGLISGSLPSIFPDGATLVPGVINVIAGSIGQFCSIVSSASGSIISAITTVIALIQAIPTVLCNPVGISGIIASANGAVSSVMSILNSISVPNSIAPVITQAIGTALNIGAGTASAIASMFSALSTKMANAFSGLNLGASVASYVFLAVQPLYNIPESILAGVITVVKGNLDKLANITNIIVNLATSALDSLASSLSTIGAAVARLFDPLLGVINSVIANLTALFFPLLHPETIVNTISQSIIDSFKPNYATILNALLNAMAPLSRIIDALGTIWDQLQGVVAQLAGALIGLLNGIFNFEGIIARIKAIFDGFFDDWLEAPEVLQQTWTCLCDTLPAAIQKLFFDEGKVLSVSFLKKLFEDALEPLTAPARTLIKESFEELFNSAKVYPPTRNNRVMMHTSLLGLTYECFGRTAFRKPRLQDGQWVPPDRFLWSIKTIMKGPPPLYTPIPFYFMVAAPLPDPAEAMAYLINGLAATTFKLIETLLCGTLDNTFAKLFEETFRTVYKDLAKLTSSTISAAGSVAGKILEIAMQLAEKLSSFISEVFGQVVSKSLGTMLQIADIITSCAYKLLIDVIKSGLPRIFMEAVKGLWHAVTHAIPNYIAAAALAPMAAAADLLNSITGAMLKAINSFFTKIAPGLAQAMISSSLHLITAVVPKLAGEALDGIVSVMKDINFQLWLSIPKTIYRTVKDMFPRAIAGSIGAAFCMPKIIAEALAKGIGGLISKTMNAIGSCLSGTLKLGSMDLNDVSKALANLAKEIVNCLLKLLPAVAQLAQLAIAAAVKLAEWMGSLVPALSYFLCPPVPTPTTITYCDGTDTKQLVVLGKAAVA